VRVDGVELTEDTDVAALVQAALKGDLGVSLPSDCYPLDWLLRMYDRLAGTPWPDRLSQGVASCLSADDPLVRSQALAFFRVRPAAVGGDRIVELARGDRTMFAGTTDPMSANHDLEFQLLSTLAIRVERGDPAALLIARDEALRTGNAAMLAGALAENDPEWTIAHAEQIVQRTPSAGLTILCRLRADPHALADLARRIVPMCHGDPRFELDARRFIDDPQVRQLVLDLSPNLLNRRLPGAATGAASPS
jgi:hypothetical protein